MKGVIISEIQTKQHDEYFSNFNHALLHTSQFFTHPLYSFADWYLERGEDQWGMLGATTKVRV